MKAEIVTVGDELLIGQVYDTNSTAISRMLTSLGIEVSRCSKISDRLEDIEACLAEAAKRSDITIMTGGLGPTKDDRSKAALCNYMGVGLVRDAEVYAHVASLMASRGIPMNDLNERQADIPEHSDTIYNRTGTAPGIWMERNGKIFVLLPGVPSELDTIIKEELAPKLERLANRGEIFMRNILLYGVAESEVALMLDEFERNLDGSISLAYLPDSGVLKLRLSSNDKKMLDAAASEMRTTLAERMAGRGYLLKGEGESLVEVLAARLMELGATVATAESCTGGSVASLLTSIAGSSQYFKGAVVAYANEVKMQLLGVKAETLAAHGAVSEQTAIEMADGVRRLLGVDYGLSTTGIAGPGGASKNKPVGTIWLTISSKKGQKTKKLSLGKERKTNVKRSCQAILGLFSAEIGA